MAKVIQDLWILTANGITMFSRIQDELLNDVLVGMLMSALDSFASEINAGGLSNFELSNKRFSFVKRNKYIFVVSSSPNVKEKKAIEELEIIIIKFFDKYKTVLEDWDNDVSIFKDFEAEIDDSLEATIKKFQKAFW